MAKVSGTHVPPSLIEPFNRILTINQALTQTGLKPTARTAQPAPTPTYTTQFITSAATWLVNRHLARATPSEKSALFDQFATELRAGIFDPIYWQALTPTSDLAEYATPTIGTFNRGIPAAYVDPAHQPSICTYQDVEMNYPTPTDGSTDEHPAPGWRGTTIANIWRDLYHVQRKLIYPLPTAIQTDDDRPIAIHVEMDITATATTRGNRNWFAFALERYLHTATGPIGAAKGAVTHWAPEDWYAYALPPEGNTPWTATIHRTILDSAHRKTNSNMDSGLDRLTLRVATPPSLGMYGSRNDDVRVTHHETIGVYWAI